MGKLCLSLLCYNFRQHPQDRNAKPEGIEGAGASGVAGATEGAGSLSRIWEYVTGSKSKSEKEELRTVNIVDANVSTNNDATVDPNSNNNAANRFSK